MATEIYDHNKIRAKAIYHRYMAGHSGNAEQWIIIHDDGNHVTHLNTYNGEVPRGFFSGTFTYDYNASKVSRKIREHNMSEWKKPCPFALLVTPTPAPIAHAI
jgi:hypothetical protein